MDPLFLAIIFLPLIIVLWLGNMADRQRERGQSGAGFAAVAYGLTVFFYVVVLLGGIILQLAGIATRGMDSASPSETIFTPELLARLGPALWPPMLLGLALLLPPVRRLLARFIPIDPASTVHALALSFIALVIVNLSSTLAVGLGNLAAGAEAAAQEETAQQAITYFWWQSLLFFVSGLVGVGWLSRRTLRQTLQRLAIVRPTGRQAALGFVVGAAMVPLALGIFAAAGAAGLSPDENVEKLTQALLGGLTRSAFGVITIGLSAALGEETIFRGALQPRFGFLLTALLFTLVHSNYGLSLTTALVLILALILGYIRRRTNTTTTMIVHATYNILSTVASYLGF